MKGTEVAWLDALGATLAEEHGALAVILYGSRARGLGSVAGAPRPESDIDLMLLVADDVPLTRKRDTRSATTPDGHVVDVDAWIHRVSEVADPAKDASLLRLRGGRALIDRDGLVPTLMAALEDLHARGPEPLSADELAALRVWGARMVRRAAHTAAGPIAAWRRAELLVQLLPDSFRLRGWWYPGPEPALRRLGSDAPQLYAAYARALQPSASVADLEALVQLAFDA